MTDTSQPDLAALIAGITPAGLLQQHPDEIELVPYGISRRLTPVDKEYGWTETELYTREQVLSLLTSEREARVKAEEERDTAKKAAQWFHSDLSKALIAAETRLKEAEKVMAPFARLALNYSGASAMDAAFAKGSVYVYELRAAAAFLAKEKNNADQ